MTLNADASISFSRCIMLLHDWSASTSELTIKSEVVECTDHFTCLRSLITPDGLVSDEITAQNQIVRSTFVNLYYLQHQRNIRLPTGGLVYCWEICPVLLYRCETWPLKIKDICRLLIFDQRCLRTTSRKFWDHRVSSSEVACRQLVKYGESIEEVASRYRLNWLGHVLCMSVNWLPQPTMRAGVGVHCKKVKGNQTKTVSLRDDTDYWTEPCR